MATCQQKMQFVWRGLVVALSAIGFLAIQGTASAGPTCASLGPPGVAIASFVSCTVVGGGPAGQDNLSNVQAALNLALDPDVTLLAAGSFFPGPGTGAEFFGTRLSDGFEITETSLSTDTFTFEMLPAGTDFITLKQGNGFEVFNVIGKALPFTLTHMLGGNATSHISTFVSNFIPTRIPEPGLVAILGLGLIGLGLVRRRWAG